MSYLEKGERAPNRREEKAVSRNGWGQSKRLVLPLLQEGKTLPEVSESTGLTYWQISNVRERARARGELPHPTPEETKSLRSRLLKGRSSRNNGIIQSLETLLRLREKRLSRELTPLEEEQTRLLVIARHIPRDRRVLTMIEFYQSHHRKPPGEGRNKAFLELFYAARLCIREKGYLQRPKDTQPFVEMSDVCRIYEQVDPGIFTRLDKEITFIRELTKASNPVSNGDAPRDDSRIANAVVFYRENEIIWPEG